MTTQKLELLDLLLEAVAAAATDPLALLHDGAVKAVVLKEMLSRGHTLREGATGTNRDWLIAGSPAAPRATLVARLGSGDGKAGIRIETPCRMVVELKAFGEVGVRSSFNRGAIDPAAGKSHNPTSFLWDLKAVTDGSADAALLVCGARQYDTARGEPWEDRGRIAGPGRVWGVILPDLLPARADFKAAISEFQRSWGDAEWRVRGRLVDPPKLAEFGFDGQPRRAAEHRVVLALWRTAVARVLFQDPVAAVSPSPHPRQEDRPPARAPANSPRVNPGPSRRTAPPTPAARPVLGGRPWRPDPQRGDPATRNRPPLRVPQLRRPPRPGP